MCICSGDYFEDEDVKGRITSNYASVKTGDSQSSLSPITAEEEELEDGVKELIEELETYG